jgi:hypothetical protein
VLNVRLAEKEQEQDVSVHPASAGASSLLRAIDDALTTGYGECFWPALTGGQYWWIFKRDENRIETIAMWTRGGASMWEHVFRATDGAEWVRDRVAEQVARLGL